MAERGSGHGRSRIGRAGPRSLLPVLLAAACAAQAPPSLPQRPPLPASWTVAASLSGDVSVGLPPDLRAQVTDSGVRAQWTRASGTALIEVWVTAPAALDQPADPDGPLRPWLEGLGWVPTSGSGGVINLTVDSQGEVLLPSGSAVEIVVTTDPGTEAELRVVTYGIRTPEGVAVIMVRGAPAVMDQRREDLRLIASLARFGTPGPSPSAAPSTFVPPESPSPGS